MKNKIGVMQGRLLPKYKGRYQAHPLGYWQDEFKIAQQIGLDCIEFILDFNDAEENPLLKGGGIDQIRAISEKTGITVYTVCADFLMEAPLHAEDQTVLYRSQQIMQRLLNNSAKLGVTDIVIPCVDQSSLNGEAVADRFVEGLKPVIEFAENHKINLSLETDLSPQLFVELLDRFNSERVTINYDIGNSAAMGHDLVEELSVYGHCITDIHIKDRIVGGAPVALGEGGADFQLFFSELSKFKYQGPFIMQAYRDDEGVKIFNKQLAWIKPYLEQFI